MPNRFRLIMPKGDGRIKPCIESLKIYYEEKGQWVSNNIFKERIAKAIGVPTDSDGPFLIKKSEIARYFGLINYLNRKGKITDRGIRFYEAYLKKQQSQMIDIIMESIKEDSFGKDNSATENSNSIIDPPKLLLKAAYELPNLNKDEVAYLLYSIHDKGIAYKNTIDQILKKRKNNWSAEVPTRLYNKYTDLKFRVFFQNIGIIKDTAKFAEISDYIYNKYSRDIETVSIYNTNDATKIGMKEIDDDEIENEILKKVPSYNKEELIKRENRVPEIRDKKRGNKRYSTDYRISKTALENAKFRCEVDDSHKTFKTKYKVDYVEGHHLIPMVEQKNYPTINIDRVNNIVALCPNCHKALHYAENTYRVSKLLKLFTKRKCYFKDFGIVLTKSSFLKMYNIS